MPTDPCVLSEPKTTRTIGYLALDDGERPTPESFSTDPDAIRYELGLAPGLTRDQVSSLRRRFAVCNHPDRLAAEFRGAATQRMMIANALCDCYCPVTDAGGPSGT